MENVSKKKPWNIQENNDELSAHSRDPREIFECEIPRLKNALCKTSTTRQHGAEQRANTRESPVSLLDNSYTHCYLVFTFLQSAVSRACVFTCAKPWLHNYIQLYIALDKWGHILSYLQMPQALKESERFPTMGCTTKRNYRI